MLDSAPFRHGTIEDHTVAYWLMKSEPDAYSIDDLKRDGTEPWDGIRNYQARNMMRDDMKIGDGVLFYHSSCKVPAVVGIAKVASGPYPDPTQFDPKAKYYDEKITRHGEEMGREMAALAAQADVDDEVFLQRYFAQTCAGLLD